MKPVMVVIAIALFCGAIAAQAMIKPATKYRQDGITVVSPDSPGWRLLKTDKSETSFEKRGESDILNAGVKSIGTKTFDTDKDRLIAWEALKQEEFSKFKQDHLHFNYTKFKGASCLLYDAIFPLEKTSSNAFAYFNVRGYLCPLPTSKDSAVQIEFSNHSNTRGFTEDLSFLAEEFFEKLALPSGSKK
jgi:hypothetical protein